MTTKLDSLALKSRSEHYPASWHGKVPSRIRMDKTVQSEMPFLSNRLCAFVGREYDAYVNSHGALCAIFDNGEMLGLKPYEFSVIAWHEADMPPLALDSCCRCDLQDSPDAPEDWHGKNCPRYRASQ